MWNPFTKYKRKLLISYFLIVVTPLIIITGMLYGICANIIREEIEASNKYKLNELKNNLELRFKELEDLASRVRVDSKLTPNNMGGNEYKRVEGMYQIGMYKAQNAFIDDYYLYYKNTGNVYSSAGQCYLSTFAKNKYNFTARNETGFFNEINSLKFPAFMAQERIEKNNAVQLEFISYMCPIAYSNYDPYGVVIFHIKKITISEMFKNITGDVKGNITIFDKNRSVLLSENKSFELSAEDLNIIKNIGEKELAEGIIYRKFNNDNCSLITDSSDITGLKFVLTIPNAQFIKKIVNIRTLIVEAFLIMLAFGALLSIVFSINIYKPINKLSAVITRQRLELNENEQHNQKRLQGNMEKKMDELDRIGQAVEITLEQNKNLKAQINMQRPFIIEQILTNLLKGETLNEPMMNSLFEFSDVRLDGPFYAVVMIDKVLKSEERFIRKFKDKVLSLSCIEEEFGLKSTVYPVELIQDNAVALILNIDIEKDEHEKYLQFILNMKRILEDMTEEQIILGGGKIYGCISKINSSFIEALAALEENKVRGRQGVLLFDEIADSGQQVLWYPIQEQLKFMQSLRRGDKEVALESLEGIFKNVKKNHASVLALKYICYDIVNMIIKGIHEAKIDSLNYNIEKLMKFSTIDGLESETKVIIQKLCEKIKENDSLKNTDLNNRVLEYINSNFGSINLSLESVADEFGFSIYYLSRFFKEHTNQTFTDYVINLRIKKAKELLSTTNFRIKEIVGQIGYTDLTYFMKMFKKSEGITPGQYRELYQNAK